MMNSPALQGNRVVLRSPESIITRPLIRQVSDILLTGLSMYTNPGMKYRVFWIVRSKRHDVLIRLGARYFIVPTTDIVTRLNRLGLEVFLMHGAADHQEALSLMYAELFSLCDPLFNTYDKDQNP